jgi:DNA primase
MAGHFNAVVQQIKERADIVGLIGRYVPLKRSGASFKGCCPFHQEKTPSFFVHPDKQFFYCFGCGAKGDVFGFFMDYEGKRFSEVVTDLAEEMGIPLPATTFVTEADLQADQKKEAFYKINYWTRQFFIDHLQSPAGKDVREYIQRRGIADDMVEAFGLGYALDDWGALTQEFRRRHADVEDGCEVGLLKQAENGDRIYDRFRHRLMFPIKLPSGRIAGFGGRVLRDEDGAKYLNSPESVIFKKSTILYGLDLAAQPIRKKQLAVLVEGYLDVICMHQFGFDHTVAALGTAFNEDHLRQLQRYTKHVLLLFDGDKAGRRAAERAMQVLLPGGISVDLLTLPDGHDPDTYLQTHGREAMGTLLEEQTKPAFDVWLDQLREDADNDPIKVDNATKQVLELLKKIDNAILRDLYLKRTAERLHVEETLLRRGLMRVVPKPSAQSQHRHNDEPSSAPLDPMLQNEQKILAMMIKVILEHPDLFSFVQQAERTHELHQPLLRNVWTQLITDLQEGGDITNAIQGALGLLDAMPQFQRRLAQSLLKDRPFAEDTIVQSWDDAADKLRLLVIERKLQELQRSIQDAQRQGDQEVLIALVQEKRTYQQEKLKRQTERGRGPQDTLNEPEAPPEKESSFWSSATANTEQTTEATTQNSTWQPQDG